MDLQSRSTLTIDITDNAPCAPRLADVEVCEDLGLDERQLVDELAHIWARTTASGTRAVISEVDLVQAGNNRTDISSCGGKQRIRDELVLTLQALF
jgi:hypothetical protein